MDIPVQTPKVQTTFIPKKSLADEHSRRLPVNFLTLFSVVIFLAAALGWGGVFIYRAALDREIGNLEESLEKVKVAFEEETLNLFIDLDRKLNTAQNLLSGHT